MNYSMEEPLSLASIGAEQDVQESYRKVLSLLKKGESGSVTLKLTIKRPEEMETMVTLETEIKMSAPPPKKRRTMGRIGQEGIFVEPASEPPSNVLTLFEGAERGK